MSIKNKAKSEEIGEGPRGTKLDLWREDIAKHLG